MKQRTSEAEELLTASSPSTVKYDNAGCLDKDREAYLHSMIPRRALEAISRQSDRDTFATVRLRTGKTKGCLSRKTALALSASPTSRRGIGQSPMVFKLAKSAERHWRRLDGSERLVQVIDGLRFHDGEPVQAAEEQAAA